MHLERRRLDDIEHAAHVVLGRCLGACISERPRDRHLTVTLLVEDDGSWYAPADEFSTAWLPDLETVLAEALRWLEANAVRNDVKG